MKLDADARQGSMPWCWGILSGLSWMRAGLLFGMFPFSCGIEGEVSRGNDVREEQ
jgi:hypothetical protein